jgi:hypothetical protein
VKRHAVALALLLLAGCGDGVPGGGPAPGPGPGQRACTEIGCDDSVAVELDRVPRGARVTLCVDGRCQPPQDVAPQLYTVTAPLRRGAGDRVRVTVTVRRGGRTLARAAKTFAVRKDRPNGPGCPPVCRFVNASFDVPSRTLQEI